MHKTEKTIIAMPFFFLLFFSGWTIDVHLSQIFELNWNSTLKIFAVLSPVVAFFSFVIAGKISNEFAELVALDTSLIAHRSLPSFPLTYTASLAAIGIGAMSMLALNYQMIVFVFLFVAVILFFIPRLKIQEENKNSEISAQSFLLVISAYIVFVSTVILFYHRSDMDDVGYLQIIVQTFRYPNLPVLGFDSSLGEIKDGFRFAPYKISAYELFVALLASIFPTDFMRIYYIWLPLLTGAASVMGAYAFSRWFLPCKYALIAVGVFIIFAMVWGETHVAYGNRLFLRMFQGKGLIIAIGAPICFIGGLMLIRRFTINSWLAFAFSLIGMIGFSSSGLVAAVIVPAILGCSSLVISRKKFILLGIAFLVSIAYPIGIYLWLHEINTMLIPLSDRGTFLPVDSSFGKGTRRFVALAAMACGIYFLTNRKRVEFFSIVIISIGLVLNPIFTGLITSIGSANMSWRIAWAIPVPLLTSVGLVSCLMYKPAFTRMGWPSLLAISLFTIFVFGGASIIAKKNHAEFHSPSLKLSGDYYLAREIVLALREKPTNGALLAPFEIGNWFPVLLPERKIIMPGHNYPMMLKAYLNPDEYKKRLELIEIYSDNKTDSQTIMNDLLNLDVSQIVLKQHQKERILDLISSNQVFNYTVSDIGHGYFMIELAKRDISTNSNRAISGDAAF